MHHPAGAAPGAASASRQQQPLPASSAGPAASCAVAPFSLEQYLEIHEALTKGQHTVQKISKFEEPWFKAGDLRAVMEMHGVPPSGRTRRVRGAAEMPVPILTELRALLTCCAQCAAQRDAANSVAPSA